jgi:hypothetical protein
MSFGGFLENTSPGGGGARIVADIPYNNNNMPTGAIVQPRLVSPSITKSMFNSPGLSLALVLIFFFLFLCFFLATWRYGAVCLWKSLTFMLLLVFCLILLISNNQT